ncbi:sensor histidine kinase [Sphingobium algorifonticola]|uniref:sensor histidine kinase n=1 Tax=Sphingobium algorifonticola TaxID=2008318 RepID=UPI0019D21114|nr:histidine kinase dimerization/phosphoacceptor domain -containing protein [Sphingobium algorifonticola]
MELFTPISHETANSLGVAIVLSSDTPLLLLDAALVVQAASGSFCRCFGLDQATVVGKRLLDAGQGEWNLPRLESLLTATVSGHAFIDGYELDLVRKGKDTARLVINAHRLDYDAGDSVRLIVAVRDITQARHAEQVKDDLVREKHVLLQELQHRVANSLQIIASVLMQGARKVQSDEARAHINDAHHRVMSIATLQRQLAATQTGDVALRPYFTDLCNSIGASMIADPDRLTLTTQIDDSVTSADVSVSLGLIVTELVINALKHAFPDSVPKGVIAVTYASTGEGWSLGVSDNGVGMKAGGA